MAQLQQVAGLVVTALIVAAAIKIQSTDHLGLNYLSRLEHGELSRL